MLRFQNLFILSLLIFVIGCVSRNSGEHVSNQSFKEPLILENQKITKDERRLIDRFIERRKWEMTETGTGLSYMIYKTGNGIQAQDGMKATVDYEISLLDGTVCYTSLENGPKSFIIGRDNVESGIHEGIKYLHVGDHAKLLIPSYLAHGLVGDQNKIPSRASLVVDLHLLRLD